MMTVIPILQCRTLKEIQALKLGNLLYNTTSSNAEYNDLILFKNSPPNGDGRVPSIIESIEQQFNPVFTLAGASSATIINLYNNRMDYLKSTAFHVSALDELIGLGYNIYYEAMEDQTKIHPEIQKLIDGGLNTIKQQLGAFPQCGFNATTGAWTPPSLTKLLHNYAGAPCVLDYLHSLNVFDKSIISK